MDFDLVSRDIKRRYLTSGYKINKAHKTETHYILIRSDSLFGHTNVRIDVIKVTYSPKSTFLLILKTEKVK